VYAPQEDNAKLEFLNEIQQIRPITSERWILIRDFNMIMQAQDKSNNNMNRRLMGAFTTAIDELELT
jgi:hypothetical protein